jgi:hypothetical protein
VCFPPLWVTNGCPAVHCQSSTVDAFKPRTTCRGCSLLRPLLWDLACYYQLRLVYMLIMLVFLNVCPLVFLPLYAAGVCCAEELCKLLPDTAMVTLVTATDVVKVGVSFAVQPTPHLSTLHLYALFHTLHGGLPPPLRHDSWFCWLEL